MQANLSFIAIAIATKWPVQGMWRNGEVALVIQAPHVGRMPRRILASIRTRATTPDDPEIVHEKT
jgi:hypothetical protein